MHSAIAGIIEGFYGTPWTWEERRAMSAWCASRGMTHLVYAPKDDPFHRERWRDPYDDDAVAAFAAFTAEGALTLGFAISPGLTIDTAAPADIDALLAKVDQMLEVGVRLIVLALDDIPVRPGLGEAHATLTAILAGHVRAADGDATVALIPTEYTGSAATPYLEALASGVPDEVLIGWTGPTVICDEISADDAVARARALGGRAPLLWDNYPVNDTIMADRLLLGPLRGREQRLRGELAGYLANPLVQAEANRLPLASTAAWLRGDDPEAAWSSAAEALGWRTFAEACDGAVPEQLAAATIAGSAAAAADLRSWLQAAAACTAPGLEGTADEWVDQVHTEAGVALLALLDAAEAALAGDRSEQVLGKVMTLTLSWPAVRRSTATVLGPRCSFRPVLSQWPDGTWRFHGSSAQIDRNATDALVRWAMSCFE